MLIIALVFCEILTKTIQRNWQHGVHKTKNNKTKTIQRNWQHGVHKDEEQQNKNNPEKLATWCT
jgi:hypothetical protein